MKSTPARTLAAYVRAIERHLEETHGPPFVLSPRDWALAEEWHQRGVPVAAVLECLASAAERKHRGRPGRRSHPRLSDVARQVDETWSVLRDGRLAAPGGGNRSQPRTEIGDLWARARERAEDGTPLAKLIDDVLGRLARGEDPAALDRFVDDELSVAAPDDAREAAARGVDAELRPFEGRWTEAQLRDARDVGIRSRLRRRLGLPRLSGRPAAREVRKGEST